MEQMLICVADDLAREFSDVPEQVVIRALCDCLREYPTSSAVTVKGLAQDRLAAFRAQWPS
ncbi:MAG: hypothetical protein ACTHOK_02225 [Nocardioidaceae bacterium]